MPACHVTITNEWSGRKTAEYLTVEHWYKHLGRWTVHIESLIHSRPHIRLASITLRGSSVCSQIVTAYRVGDRCARNAISIRHRTTCRADWTGAQLGWQTVGRCSYDMSAFQVQLNVGKTKKSSAVWYWVSMGRWPGKIPVDGMGQHPMN